MASRLPSYVRNTSKATTAIQRIPFVDATQASPQKLRPIHIPLEAPGQISPRQPPWDQIPADAKGLVPIPPARVLARLPMASLLRSITIQAAMSRPILMNVATTMLRSNLKQLTGTAMFRYVLDKIFYAQFCAGRTEAQIKQTVRGLRALGYRGAILSYAREVDLSQTPNALESANLESIHQLQVAQWLEGTINTIKYAHRRDMIAIKYTGAGQRTVEMLEQGAQPDSTMANALDKICSYAREKGVRIMIDAEHYSQQKGIDSWTMDLMERFNKSGEVVIYNTYQMYLKESPATLAKHLKIAKERNFNLGVKLVRGAYINSDPRHVIFDTKAETDNAFDNAARMLATHHINDPSAPKIGVVLASHNKESMEMMRELRREQIQKGLPRADVVYAQLMGMADELSMSLTQSSTTDIDDDAHVFKYVVWGTTEECVMYLLRRAEENKDAVERSASSQKALWGELWGRLTPKFLKNLS
ncbi:proline dehydrogenase [Myotisia sp. PD_48]|nr:proline dehydrogenase [Myotisia sp. PD_48]